MSAPTNVRSAFRSAPHLTHVELTWREKKIEHWIRFCHPVTEKRLDRHRRIVSFSPDGIFAFVRWAANYYGTVVSRIDIVRAVAEGESYQTLPFVRPGTAGIIAGTPMRRQPHSPEAALPMAFAA